jgi:membrane-bound lytic murein transglycosylase B
MGISQFMPSNILKLGVDGDNDGRVDLFTHPDAIFSVASFLAHHGWKPGLDHQAAYKVLLNYNYSRPYAETVLKIRERLKAGPS